MPSLESRHYVAGPADIEAIAIRVLQAAETAGGGQTTYLKAFTATVQNELDSPPRGRDVPLERLSAADIPVHLAALEKVDALFYLTVKKAAAKMLATKDPLELNRRTNFARSAKATLRRFIAAGFDIRTRAAARVTKASLAEAVPTPKGARRVASPKVLTNRTRKALDDFNSKMQALVGADKVAARKLLEAAGARIAETLASLEGASPTRDLRKARKQRRPFKSDGTTFFPASRHPRQARAAL